MKVEIIRTIKIILPEPITVECSENSFTEIVEISLREHEARELYSQLMQVFEN